MLVPWSIDDPKMIQRCWEVYKEGLKFSDSTEATDNLPGDDALLLACYTLVKTYATTSITVVQPVLTSEQAKYLLQAALCLESGLEKSKYNFQFKLLLVRVYLLLGSSL